MWWTTKQRRDPRRRPNLPHYLVMSTYICRPDERPDPEKDPREVFINRSLISRWEHFNNNKLKLMRVHITTNKPKLISLFICDSAQSTSSLTLLAIPDRRRDVFSLVHVNKNKYCPSLQHRAFQSHCDDLWFATQVGLCPIIILPCPWACRLK